MDAEKVRGSSPGSWGAGAAPGALGVTEDPSRPQDSFIHLSPPAGPRDGCPEGTPERVRREIERCQVRSTAAGGVGSGRSQNPPGRAAALSLSFLVFLGLQSRSGGGGLMAERGCPTAETRAGRSPPPSPASGVCWGRAGGGGHRLRRVSPSDGASHRSFVALWSTTTRSCKRPWTL